LQAYLFNDDDFNINYGLAKTSTGHYKEAEEHLTMVQNDKVKPHTLKHTEPDRQYAHIILKCVRKVAF
jgi:hypothetical protein